MELLEKNPSPALPNARREPDFFLASLGSGTLSQSFSEEVF
jgi:hypothetical protein